MLGGTILTGKQLEELNSATDLVKSLKRAMQGIYHEGDSGIVEDLDALLELTRIVFEKLDFVGCDDDLDAALSRVPEMSQPEKLSELIVQLLKVYRANGDMKVYSGDMQRVGELELVADPEEPEKHGPRFLHVGPY